MDRLHKRLGNEQFFDTKSGWYAGGGLVDMLVDLLVGSRLLKGVFSSSSSTISNVIRAKGRISKAQNHVIMQAKGDLRRFRRMEEKILSQEIAEMTRENLINQLDGVTTQSTNIAQGIRDGRIGVNMLPEHLYNKALQLHNVQGSPKAFGICSDIYLNQSSSRIWAEAVHEGTHALDWIAKKLPPYTSGSTLQAFNNRMRWEIRAYVYQRQYMLAKGIPIHGTIFETYQSMIAHIKFHYK